MIENTTATDPLAALRTPTQNSTQEKEDLGQADFLTLMLAQMKNQDPTEPMDTNEFMSQLAQFSTVNGIEELKASVDEVKAIFAADQSVKAANLVGHGVMAPSNLAQLEPGGALTGEVWLDQGVGDLNLHILTESGALVRTLPMGAHGSGAVPFTWDGFTEDGTPAPPGAYRVVAEYEGADGTEQAEVRMRAEVVSVSLSPYGGEMMLNLDNGRSLPLSAVQEIL